MKAIIKIASILFLFNLLLQGQPTNGLNMKLGIVVFSGESIFSAKTYEKIRGDDKFQVIVQCKEENYIYIINYDDKKAKILYHTSISANELTQLPDSSHYFSFDGQVMFEHLSLLIYKDRNLLLEQLFQNNVLSSELWIEKEKKLQDESIFQFGGEYKFPRIAGNVRGDDSIWLLEFSSDTHFIRKYTFYVKK